MSWLAETMEKTFQNYLEDFEGFVKAKRGYNDLCSNLIQVQHEYDQGQIKEKEIKVEFERLTGTEVENPEEKIETVRKQAETEIAQQKQIREEGKAKALEKKERDLSNNDKDLAEKLKCFDEENDGTLDDLTEAEKKALEFAQEELSYIKERDRKIHISENHTDEEKDKYDKINERCRSQIEKLIEEYEPSLAEWQEVIDEINEKHRPAIDEQQEEMRELVSAKNREISSIDDLISDENRLYDSQYRNFSAQYDQTRKEYKKSITAATLRKEPTAQLNISMNAALNSINQQIDAAKIRCDREVNKLNQRKVEIGNKYDEKIGKIRLKLNRLESARDSELAEPLGKYNSIKNERDGKIAVPDGEKNKALQKYNQERQKDNTDIQEYRNQCADEIAKLRIRMETYAMNGENCYAEKYEVACEPFVKLASHKREYEKSLELVSYTNDFVDNKKNAARADLDGQSYKVLKEDAVYLEEHGIKSIPEYYKYAWYILGGSIILDTLIFSILLFIAHWPSVFAVLLPSGAIGAVVFMLYGKMQESSRMVAKAYVLATEYSSYKVIDAYANELATQEEYGKLNAIGQNLLAKYEKRESVIREHEEREDAIKEEYNNEISRLEETYDSNKQEINKKRDAQIQSLRQSAKDKNGNRDDKINELQREYDEIVKFNNKNRKYIEKKTAEKKDQERILESFDKDYKEFCDKYFDQEKGMSEDLDISRGVLNDAIYLVSSGDRGGDYGEYNRIKRLEHNKDPFLVLYDSPVGISNVDKNHLVRTILTDFLLAMKSINSKDILEQYIVDYTGASMALRDKKFMNLFKISKIGVSMAEMKQHFENFWRESSRMSERGENNIDALNVTNLERQERPNTYKVIYFVYNETENERLDDMVMRLLQAEAGSACHGYLAFFICDKKTWEINMEKNNNGLYSQIHSFVEDRVVTYKEGGYC